MSKSLLHGSESAETASLFFPSISELHYAFIPRSDFNYIKVIAYLHFGIFCIISLGESVAKFGILSLPLLLLLLLHCFMISLCMDLCVQHIHLHTSTNMWCKYTQCIIRNLCRLRMYNQDRLQLDNTFSIYSLISYII